MLTSYQAIRVPDKNGAQEVTTLQAGMNPRSQEWANEKSD